MTSWIDAVKAKKDKGAGIVKVDFAGTALEIRLQYPTAKSRIKVGELVDEFRKKVKDGGDDDAVSDKFAFSDRLEVLIVKECLPEAEANDDDVLVLIRETGGTDSPLVQRCAKLIGVESMVGGDDEEKETKSKKR